MKLDGEEKKKNNNTACRVILVLCFEITDEKRKRHQFMDILRIFQLDKQQLKHI